MVAIEDPPLIQVTSVVVRCVVCRNRVGLNGSWVVGSGRVCCEHCYRRPVTVLAIGNTVEVVG